MRCCRSYALRQGFLSCLLVYAADIDANGFCSSLLSCLFRLYCPQWKHNMHQEGGSACVFSEATLVTTERLHVLRVLKWDLKPAHDVSPYLHISKIQQDHVFIFPLASSLRLSSPTITLFLKYTVITLKKKMEKKNDFILLEMLMRPA